MTKGGEGLACPACGGTGNYVVDSRAVRGNHGIRRRRACQCGHRFRTYEFQVPAEGVFVRLSREHHSLTVLPLERFVSELMDRLKTAAEAVMMKERIGPR